MGTKPLALLVDGENVAEAHIAAIMARAEQLGEPVARCVVGDFSEARLAGWKKTALRCGLEPVFQASCGKGKNSADIALTICAMDLLSKDLFTSFLIVSSDCDFAPLAVRLRRSGVAVYGMGEAKADSAWRNACTKFYDLPPKPSAGATAKPGSTANSVAIKPIWSGQDGEAVYRILRKATASGPSSVKLSQLGQLIRQHSKELGTRLGKGKLLKNLRRDPSFKVDGQGTSIEVRLEDCSKPESAPVLRIVPRPFAPEDPSAGATLAADR